MTQILIHPESMGLDAKAARLKLTSPSVRRADITFIPPQGAEVILPAKSEMLSVLNAKVWPEGQGKPAGVDDVMALWEKDYALKVLRDKEGFESGIRTERIFKKAEDADKTPKAPRQWDYVEISVESTVSEEDWAIIQEEAINSFRDTRQNAKMAYDENKQPVPFVGINGKRAVFVSTTHDNTGNRHIHILANRIAFDMEGKKISSSVDLSRNGNLIAGMNDLQRRLVERGVTATSAIAGTIGSDLVRNQQQKDAKASMDASLADAGGRSLDETRTSFSVEVPLGNGQTTFVAAPLTTDEVAMQRHLSALKESNLRAEREIERMKAEVQANTGAVTMVEQALQAIANERILRANLDEAHNQLSEAAVVNEDLTTTNESLTSNLEQAEGARQRLHDAFLNIGADLTEGQKILGLDAEQVAAVQRGDTAAIGAIVADLGGKVSGINQAIDNFPEDLAEVAEAMRTDTFDGLNALLDELQKTRQSNASLTDKLAAANNDLATANTLNGELQTKLTTMESDLENIKAQMAKKEEEFERRMAEQAQLVRNAQSDVARAEGKVSAKQEQLDEEKAKVEKLTRTKDAVMDLMTSDNPGQAWETTKNYLQDDAFANRAMGAYLRTVSELEQAQQRIATMQNELVDLGQVRENLVAAQATIEEQLGRVNDGGVADLRALNEQNKKLQADNEKLQQQVRDLADAADEAQKARPVDNAALEAEQQEAVFAREETRRANAEIERLKAALAKAESQASQAPDLDPKLQKALDLMQGNPEWAAVIEEATDNPSLREIILEFTRQSDQQTGMQPAQGPTDQGTDYTKGLTRDNDGPKQDDPDQSNKQ